MSAPVQAPSQIMAGYKTAPEWILYAFIGFMLILAIIIGVKRYVKNNHTDNTETKWEWNIVNTQIVTLTKEYGEFYSFPNPDRFDGSGFDCLNATKPYKAINMAGYEVSCGAGDNIGKYLPKSDPNNMRVRFKLRDSTDQIGEVTYISKKEIRVPK